MKTAAIKAKQPVLKSATIRDFGGGWNILDDDLNLTTRFSRKLYNLAVLGDGTVTLRYGTKLFSNVTPYLSSAAKIVNMEYYSAAIIVVASNGDVLSVLADGSVSRIWDATIAASLPGAPTGWSSTDFASFAQFNGELIICNGVDKPLIVFADLSVDYLSDLATNSNLNTPVGKYCTVCDRYLIIAGDPVYPNRIHISAKDTSGTFYGDPNPNDATFIDVGSILNNSSYVRGVCSFRGKLIIGFVEGTIIGDLGSYVGDVHVPTFEDPVEQYGAASHRSMISYGDDMLMMDLVGIPSLKRTVFTGTLRPERISDLIDTEMSSRLNVLSFSSIEDRCWAVYNQREGQFMFFIPNTDEYGSTTETTAYSFIYRPSLNVSGWSRYDGWNFTAGCRSIQGEIFFGDVNGKIWHYGNRLDPFYEDYMNDPSQDSRAIVFDWELPWSDINKRMKSKTSRYISFDTEGNADFTVNMYVDRFRFNNLGADNPQLSMTFVAGDSEGFGDGDQPFGGGRNTADEELWEWPAKFQIMKLRFSGSATDALKFVGISLLYQEGNYYR